MDREAFLGRIDQFHKDGWRLAIINATAILPSEELEAGAYDITWSFAKGTDFETIRERVLPGEQVPSVGDWYGYSFTYENEMRELFGINMTGIALDLHGQLYKTATKVPFSPSAIRARLEASGRVEHGAKPAPAAAPKPAAPTAPAPAASPAAPAPNGSSQPAPSPEANA